MAALDPSSDSRTFPLRARRQEPLAALRSALVETGDLSPEEFEDAEEDYHRYESTRAADDSDWPELSPVAFIESRRPDLAFRAWAAIHRCPGESIQEMCQRLGTVFGPEFFQGKEIQKAIPPGLPLGETLKHMGALEDGAVDNALRLQNDIESTVGVRLLLGILLVRTQQITVGERFHALAIQCGLENFDSIDDRSFEAIQRAQTERKTQGVR